MARRDIEKIIGELGEIRRMLADPNTGITALCQVQESRHSKVLEHVTYSTTGVREENRELRRRQERMLGDLGEVRSAMEGLRREIAQAWAHTLGLPHIPGTAVAGQVHDAQQQTPALEPGGDLDDERKGGASVSERPEPDASGERADGQPPAEAAQAHPQPDVPDDEERVLVAAQPLPAVSDPHVNGAAGVPAAASGAGQAQPVAPGISPDGGKDSDTADTTDDRYREHLRGLLAAAAVSSARLVCHKDTWAFLVEQSLRHAHFRLPDRITDTDDGQIDTRLSGRSLLAVLVTTQHILDQPATDDLAAWALAHAINQRTREAVTAASSAPGGRSGDTDVTTIVLDDRPSPSHA